MAVNRVAHTSWTGGLKDGSGTVFFDSSGIGAYEVTWPARAEQPGGKTSPEELIAAALSSCYSMALAHILTERGTPPASLDTQAKVTFEPGAGITGIQVSVRGSVADVVPTAITPHETQSTAITPHETGPTAITPHETGPTAITPHDFQMLAEEAKNNCPVSQALTGVEITLEAELLAG